MAIHETVTDATVQQPEGNLVEGSPGGIDLRHHVVQQPRATLSKPPARR
jgi:hypothetical protein